MCVCVCSTLYLFMCAASSISSLCADEIVYLCSMVHTMGIRIGHRHAIKNEKIIIHAVEQVQLDAWKLNHRGSTVNALSRLAARNTNLFWSLDAIRNPAIFLFVYRLLEIQRWKRTEVNGNAEAYTVRLFFNQKTKEKTKHFLLEVLLGGVKWFAFIFEVTI